MEKYQSMKYLFAIIFFSFISFTAKSQTTTEEEYNYLTKGYKFQFENGMDMKKGYHFQDILVDESIKPIFNLRLLIRDNQTKPCGTLIIYKSPTTQQKFYLCIPTSSASQELLNDYVTTLKSFSAEDLGVYSALFSYYYSYIVDSYIK